MQRTQMLVHRIMVVHVELHHRHDPAECANEFAEHAGLVHAAQHGFGLVLRGQNLEEQAVGLFVAPHLGIDQLERAGRSAHRFGMDRQIVLLRQIKQSDQIDRIALEDIGADEVDAVVVDDEIVGLGERAAAPRRAQPRDHAAQYRRRFGLQFLQTRAEEGGEIADMLGGEEVMLHEALDILQSGMLGVTEPHRDIALDVE